MREVFSPCPTTCIDSAPDHAAIITGQRLASSRQAMSPPIGLVGRGAQSHPRERVAALIAAMAIAPTGWRALIEIDDERLRWTFTDALDDPRLRRTPLVPALLDALQNDSRTQVRAWAAHALGVIGRAAIEAVPAIVDALESNDVRVVTFALLALANLTPADSDSRHHIKRFTAACYGGCSHGQGVSEFVRCRRCGRVASRVVREVVTALLARAADARRPAEISACVRRAPESGGCGISSLHMRTPSHAARPAGSRPRPARAKTERECM